MGGCGFFRREKLGFVPVDEVNWIVAEPANYDAFLFAPVLAGLWWQRETDDGTYSLADLLDAHEILTVRNENERRAREAAEMLRGMK